MKPYPDFNREGKEERSFIKGR